MLRRATHELSCPEDQLTLIQTDHRTQIVSGCGQTGTYVKTCHGIDCTWVLNSTARPDEPVASSSSGSEAPPAEPALEEARIEEGRDKQGRKQLKLYLRGMDWMLYVNATPGADADVASFVWRISGQYEAKPCEIKLVANGERVEVGSASEPVTHESAIDYRSSLPYASLLQIAKSDRVVGKLCNVELTLTPAQLEKTRELTLRIKETQALDEDPAPSAEREAGPKEI